jgi:protease-4
MEFSNKKIEQLLTSQLWYIDEGYGIAALNSYIHDIYLRQNGFSANDIGLSERRHANKALVYSAGVPINDAKLIYNTSLTPAGSIAVLKLSGVMLTQGGPSSNGIELFVNDLRAAYANENITSVILEINSGGGEATAGAMLKNAIEERNKPVLSYGWLVASAAYLAAAATDEIIGASQQSRFGSIGGLFSLDKELLDTYASKKIDIYADQSTGKSAEFRAAQEGDFSKFKKLATEQTAIFHSEVMAMRTLKGNEGRIKSTLDGSMFFAQEAKSRGLVDNIGNFNLALDRAQRWAKKKRM